MFSKLPSQETRNPDARRSQVTAKQLNSKCPRLLIFQSFDTILVTADSSSSTLFSWPLGCYWIYPVLDTFEYFVSQPGPPEVLTWMQVHSTQAFAFTPDRNSNVPPAAADAAVDTLRPRCRGAFCLAHFLCSLSFSFCSLDWCFALLSERSLFLFSSLLFALLLAFSFTYNAIYEHFYETETTHTLYKFMWFIRGCQPLGWISDTPYL